MTQKMKIFTNSTIHYNSLISVNYDLLTAVSIYSTILFFISLCTNGSLVITIMKNKKELKKRKEKHNINILSLALGIFNLIGTVVGLPVTTITSFKQRYKLNYFKFN